MQNRNPDITISGAPRSTGFFPLLRALIRPVPLALAALGMAGTSLAAASEAAVQADSTRLAGIFGDNMVLQQDAQVNIWGWDRPDKRIELTPGWGDKVVVISDDTGYWKAVVQTVQAGGPHELLVEGTDVIRLENILLGEVWLCSGQSNMQMPMKGFPNQPVVNSQEELLDADKPEIRFFLVERNQSDEPQPDVKGKWQICTPESIKEFSAAGYFFGDKLLEQLQVPVGLIGSYWGGTVIEAWTDQKTLADGFSDQELRNPVNQPGRSTLYNGMIHPLIPFTIKGAIWYQGESNRAAPDVYQRLLPAMVDAWRSLWNQGNFPFYYVQIAPYHYEGADMVGTALLREAQLKASELIENSGMVVSLDHGNCECIHPFNKKPIGERLAYYALKNQYGFSFLQPEGPVLKEMQVEGNQAVLSFENTPNGIISRYEQLEGFEIAGPNRIFFPALAFVNANGTLTVWAPEVKEPAAVRYAFTNCPEATLFNTEGLPASSFRTDDW